MAGSSSRPCHHSSGFLTFHPIRPSKNERPSLFWMGKEFPVKTKLAVGVLIATAGLLMSQERFDLKVRNYFFAGFAGDEASFAKGMKMCEDALAENPKLAEALVWHGSGLFAQSRQAFQKGDFQVGLDLWQRGLKEMDDAAALEPD